MPWDGTELRVGAAVGGVTVADSALVMGGPSESVLAPRWRNEESLYVISDASGWWNVYEVAAVGGATPRPLHRAEEEFAGPLWQLGGRPFELLSDGRLAVLHGLGELHLAVLDPATGSLDDVDLPGYRTVDPELAVSGTTLAAVAAARAAPGACCASRSAGPAPGGRPEVIKRQPVAAPDPAYLPDARPIELSSGRNARVVHALVYAPANPDVTAPAGELPPFIVHVHGGPTSNSQPTLSMERAFFTSRGIGIIDVNYGGSTGYGRAYRERLRGEWGVVDVADAMNAALALAGRGRGRPRPARHQGRLGRRLDGPRRGDQRPGPHRGRPGGVRRGDVLLRSVRPAAVRGRHPRLRVPLPGRADRPAARGGRPLHRAGAGRARLALTCPVLLLQGLDDPIVPPAQSEAIAADLAAYGIPHAYLAFEGESHGFRKAETVIACLEAEIAFYGEVFGFTPPGVAPIKLS